MLRFLSRTMKRLLPAGLLTLTIACSQPPGPAPAGDPPPGTNADFGHRHADLRPHEDPAPDLALPDHLLADLVGTAAQPIALADVNPNSASFGQVVGTGSLKGRVLAVVFHEAH